MATAGRPLSARPRRARNSSRICQLGANAAARVSRAEASSETTITGLRPQTSDSELATSMAMASMPVVTDSARLLAAAPSWNSAANSGRSGWTL